MASPASGQATEMFNPPTTPRSNFSQEGVAAAVEHELLGDGDRLLQFACLRRFWRVVSVGVAM
eukprot:3275578-Pleurochrysis_carterae.AAC.1